jgi:hypothetical protein
MKARLQKKRMVHGALLLAALLGGMVAVPGLRAQPVVRKVDSRFLFVFDTSAEMKHRVKAVQYAISSILATSADGQLHSNDSIGVWTFDRQLQTGQFPLQRWKPDQAVTMASTINAFVGSQRYSTKTSFDVLLPLLNKVVQNSERLTVVIFCDGYGEIHGTPYDTGVNQVFQQRQGERQKARQPIVIVLHSQLGQYVDCMVSFPPQPVSFPEFPPMPAAAPPASKAAPAPAPARPVVPPLIIIGTPVTNRVPPPAPRPVPTNPPPPAATSTSAPAMAPEAGPLDEGPLKRPSGMPAQLKMAPGVLPPTNAISRSSESAGISRVEAFALGVVFLAVVGLVVFLFGRTRPVKKD